MPKKLQKNIPFEEEEEDDDVEDMMDYNFDEIQGMSLEDLLSPEEMELLGDLINAVDSEDIELVKTVISRK